MFLTDQQWTLVQPLLPTPPPAAGRPPADPRRILDAILYKLATRVPCRLPPPGLPHWKTCFDYYQCWLARGVPRAVLHALRRDLETRGAFDLEGTLGTDLVRFEWQGRRLVYCLPVSVLRVWQFETDLL